MNLLDLLVLPWYSLFLSLFAIVTIRSILFMGVPILWSQTSQWAQARQVIRHKLMSARQYMKQLIYGLFIIALDASVSVVLFKNDILHITKTQNLLHFLTVFILLFIWTEIYFYYSHRLLHHPKLFWIHKTHHQQVALSPLTSLSFSVIERFVLLGGIIVLPAFLSQWFPFSVEAYAGYFFLNYFLNVFGHLNVEVIHPKLAQSKIGRLFLTPTYHGLHHLRYRGHYGLFTTVLDRWHNTYFNDYPEVHLKTINQPVTTHSTSIEIDANQALG